jgi:hypothetical protein
LAQSIAWTAIDYPTRLVVLHETNSAISKQRERLDLAPFDDGLPGDPPNVFSLIRTAKCRKSRCRPPRKNFATRSAGDELPEHQ